MQQAIIARRPVLVLCLRGISLCASRIAAAGSALLCMTNSSQAYEIDRVNMVGVRGDVSLRLPGVLRF
jgi:hypothetical protein